MAAGSLELYSEMLEEASDPPRRSGQAKGGGSSLHGVPRSVLSDH